LIARGLAGAKLNSWLNVDLDQYPWAFFFDNPRTVKMKRSGVVRHVVSLMEEIRWQGGLSHCSNNRFALMPSSPTDV
jgi:hypothetical protein